MPDMKDNITINKRRSARGAVLGLLEEGYPCLLYTSRCV